jgi:hypothetical protein
VLHSFDDYTNEQLRAELVRRAGPKGQPKVVPIKHCDECLNFVSVSLSERVPDTYNPCRLGHAMNFRYPQDGPNDTDWGFYRRSCLDRELAA